MYNGLDWYVQKYGIVIDEYEKVTEGRHKTKQIIYKYEGKLYLETWYNGIRLLFQEMCY